MWVIHTHWEPPKKAADSGGILFWAETPEAEQPQARRGPISRKPKRHPFCLSPAEMRRRIGPGTPFDDAREQTVTLLLPTTRTSPLPSPELNHAWELDTERRPFLSPWTVSGLWLPTSAAFSVLVNLPDESPVSGFILGQDPRYWRKACSLVLETLAKQKILPVLVPSRRNGEEYTARWQPVLDGPRDGPRLALLTAAMPPICRAQYVLDSSHPDGRPPIAARLLLDSFLYTLTDVLARSWGRAKAPITVENEDPRERWLAALFDRDPAVRSSESQLKALHSSLRSWMHNLHASGDQTFRIAFRLDAPPAGDGLAEPESGERKEWKISYLLQSRADPSLFVPAEEVWRKGNNLRFTPNSPPLDQPQEKLLAGLGYAARHFPPILKSLQSRQPTGLTIDTQQAYEFLREAVPVLEQAGFGLFAPPWWKQRGARLGMRLRLLPGTHQPPTDGHVTAGKLGLNSLVKFEWELSLGETRLTRQEFEALAAMKVPLVQVRGQWVQLDSEQIEAALRFLETQQQTGQISLLEAARYSLGERNGKELPLDEVVAEGWVAEWLDRLSDRGRLTELPQPKGLNGQLRPYQQFGFSWLAFFRRWGLGACLADDMGLGKTIQALAMLLFEKEQNGSLPGPTLLVCPTSVVTNWEREVRRFAPSLTTLVHQGPNRPRNGEFRERALQVDLVLTSYALLRQDNEWLRQVKWYGVILDEAQNIKNPAAKQTQAARKLEAGFRFALTGTPVENRLSDLWSIMQFLNPGYLGPQQKFRREFAVPIERFGDPEATQDLKSLVSPFILRRVKTDPRVIQDLPEKIETKEYCHLSEEQATLYQAVVDDVMEKIAKSEGIERRGQVLAMLTKLKQVCNHPAQFLKEKHAYPDHSTAVRNGRSGKLTRLTEMIEELLSTGDRAIIFTQFAEMGHLLADYLPLALGVRVQYLHGGTPAGVRDQMVQRFQEDPSSPPIFILSLKAGGFGLNLTSANHVFHFDRWWNPAVENQATDRAYRIGQNQTVEVHKFITAGTLEERIDDMIESKKGLAESIVGSGEEWLTELSTDDLRELVRLRR